MPKQVLLVIAAVTILVAEGWSAPSPQIPDNQPPVPIVLDTDIGSDIDDAFALALILKSPELDLLGVTTASGDTAARARIAAKLLTEAGRPDVPVAAGDGCQPLPLAQGRWADGFVSAQIHSEGAAQLFAEVTAGWAENTITLVAIGPLTNVAHYVSDPAKARKIKSIVLMGGSVRWGYGQSLTPVAEYNIAQDPKAAQAVFNSGVPIVMAPLDVTAMLKMDGAARHRMFTQLTPLSNGIALLYHLWGGVDPILFDAMAVGLVIDPTLCQAEQLTIQVDDKGFTREVKGKAPNATVGVHTDAKRFLDFFLARVAPQP